MSEDKSRISLDHLMMTFSSFIYMKLLPTVIIIGIIGNVLILVTSHYNPTKSTGFRYIWFLALSDLGACLMVIFWPVLHVMANYYKWPFLYTYAWNAFLIYFVNVSINVFMKASTLLTCSLTMDRYVALHFPLSYRKISVPRMVNLAVLASFIVPVCLMVPRVLQYRIVPMPVPHEIPTTISVQGPKGEGLDFNFASDYGGGDVPDNWASSPNLVSEPKDVPPRSERYARGSPNPKGKISGNYRADGFEYGANSQGLLPRPIIDNSHLSPVLPKVGEKRLLVIGGKNISIRGSVPSTMINASTIYGWKRYRFKGGSKSANTSTNGSSSPYGRGSVKHLRFGSGLKGSKDFHFVPNANLTSLPAHTAYQWIREIMLTFAPLALLIILNISIVQRYKVNMQKRASMINIKKQPAGTSKVTDEVSDSKLVVETSTCVPSCDNSTRSSATYNLTTNKFGPSGDGIGSQVSYHKIGQTDETKSCFLRIPRPGFLNRHGTTTPNSQGKMYDTTSAETPFLDRKNFPESNGQFHKCLSSIEPDQGDEMMELVKERDSDMSHFTNDEGCISHPQGNPSKTMCLKPLKGWNNFMKHNPIKLNHKVHKNGKPTVAEMKRFMGKGGKSNSSIHKLLPQKQKYNTDTTPATKKDLKSAAQPRDLKAEKARKHLKDERRLTIMLITVVSLHFVCNIPQAIVTILDTRYHNTPVGASFYFQIALISTNVLEALNFAANFYLYCVFIKDFRAQVKVMLTKLFSKISGRSPRTKEQGN